MQPHEQRVVDEKKELDEKMDKLDKFIQSNPLYGTLAKEDQKLLERQYKAMDTYSYILGQRIAKFQV